MMHNDGYWVPQLAPRQMDVFNNKAVYQLVSGPVRSGKSFAVEHKVVRHLWDTQGARFAAFSRTIKAAKHGGSYEDLIGIIIPQWLDAGLVGVSPNIRFEYTVLPKVDGQTRTSTFKIRNRYGGESEFVLFSLDHDEGIEGKIKQTRFSGFWFIEVTNFGDDDGTYKIWRTTSSRLRMVHLKQEDHCWLADCNPSEDGEEFWAHKLFYQKSGLSLPEDEWVIKNLSVTEFQISDNPWLTENQIAQIKSENRSDIALYARNIEGKWVARQTGGHFTDLFLHSTHVQGTVTSPRKEDWEVILPTAGVFEMSVGLDPGDLNHAAVFASKRHGEGGEIYDFIDEVVSLGRKVSISDFTSAILERMDFWEAFLLSEYGVKEVKWRHWSDSSAMDFNSGIGGSEDKMIYAESLGRIELRGVPKPKGSVRDGVQVIRRLLHENRLFVSAQLTHMIAMFQNLKRGSTNVEFVAPSQHKHVFDAARYLITGESPPELFARMQKVRGVRQSTYIPIAA